MEITRRKLIAVGVGGSIAGGAGYFSQRVSWSEQEIQTCEEQIGAIEEDVDKGKVYQKDINVYQSTESIQLTVSALQNDVSVSASMPPDSTAEEDQLAVEQVSTSPPKYKISKEVESSGEIRVRVSGVIPSDPNQFETLLDTTETLANEDSVTVKTEFEESDRLFYSVNSQSGEGTIYTTIRTLDGSVLNEMEHTVEGQETISIESSGDHEIEFSVDGSVETDWELNVEKQRSVPQETRFLLSGVKEYSSVECAEE